LTEAKRAEGTVDAEAADKNPSEGDKGDAVAEDSRSRMRSCLASAIDNNSLQDALDSVSKAREARKSIGSDKDCPLPAAPPAATTPEGVTAPPDSAPSTAPAVGTEAAAPTLQPMPPSTSKPVRPQRPKSAAAVFHQAQPAQHNTIYIPKAVNDPIKGLVNVLVEENGNMWRATNDLLKTEAGGIGYRTSKDLTDLLRGVGMSLKWGESLHGFDEGDGWVGFQLQAQPAERASATSAVQSATEVQEPAAPETIAPETAAQENESLTAVVQSLCKQMEELKRENQNLVEKLQKKRPESAR